MKHIFTLSLCFLALSLSAYGQVPDYVPTEGLVAWYPMESSLANAFGDEHNGEFFSIDSVDGANAESLGASIFNGTDSYGYVEDGLLLEGGFSVSFWIRSDLGTFNYNPIVMIGDGLSCDNELSQLEIYVGNNGVTVSHNRAQSSSSFHYFQSVDHMEWVHVGFSQESGTMTMFVQGTPVEQADMSDLIASDMPLFVGYTQFINGETCVVDHFEGALDELGFWNRSLDDAEMMALYMLAPIVYGCTDIQACNYNESANEDDGTCASCAALATACGEGTVWDSETQTCIVANPSDSNFDGCVELNDLLDLLGAYGDCAAEESAWQCGDPLEYQGYEYETVQIGDQCWCAENLRSELYANGDVITSSLSDEEWVENITGAVTVYGEGSDCQANSPDIDACNPNESLTEYGRLYNFHAVLDARSLCPTDWRIPSDDEWSIMTDELGGSSVAGDMMKTTFGWSNGGGTNTSGFRGLPGGNRGLQGENTGGGLYGDWWTSTPNSGSAWLRNLYSGRESVDRYLANAITSGLSVRCIKD